MRCHRGPGTSPRQRMQGLLSPSTAAASVVYTRSLEMRGGGTCSTCVGHIQTLLAAALHVEVERLVHSSAADITCRLAPQRAAGCSPEASTPPVEGGGQPQGKARPFLASVTLPRGDSAGSRRGSVLCQRRGPRVTHQGRWNPKLGQMAFQFCRALVCRALGPWCERVQPPLATSPRSESVLTRLFRAGQSQHILYESASGYALFELVESEEVAALHEQVQSSVTDLERFSKIVKLKAFQVRQSRRGLGSRRPPALTRSSPPCAPAAAFQVRRGRAQ